MGSSCCMGGCLFSLPAACPGISKGSYQACIMSPSPTPMQMAKLPLNTWSYPVAEHCLQGKRNDFFPPPGDGQRTAGLRLLDHSWVQHRKAGLNNSITAPVSTAQARLRGLETVRNFSSVNLCSSWELLHSSILKSCGYLGYTEEGSAFDTHCTENKCVCGGRRQAKHKNSMCKLCLFSHQHCHVVISGRFTYILLPALVVSHHLNQWTSLFPA